ncbi:MAG: hypothetical protein K9I25_05120 [Crocinitomicaceae bacterium]|nr:hypothetical protein [Crocinitomicaceae bacterium]
MKWCFFWVFCVIFSHSLVAQAAKKLPKKLCGTFLGTQPAYMVSQHNQSIPIDPAALSIEVSRNAVSICYKNPGFCPVLNGSITAVKKMGKGRNQTWNVRVRSVNSLILEELIFNPKTKVLIRTGVFPQPNTLLKKSRKK